MSEISIKFRLNIDDIIKYNKAVMRKSNAIVTTILLIITGFFIIRNFISKDTPYAMTGLLIILFISVIARPVFSDLSIKKIYKDLFMLKTDMIMDFYDDHIVEKNETDERNIKYEDHFPLEAIKNIVETKEHYFFFVSPLESLIIPKRALSEKDTIKINNLIQNIFSGKHEKRN